MTDGGVRVGGSDHLEPPVPNRYEATGWYGEALGLEVVGESEHRADLSAYPLTISGDGGGTMLALFGGSRSTRWGGFGGEPSGPRERRSSGSGSAWRAVRTPTRRGPEGNRFRKRVRDVPFGPDGHPSEVTADDYYLVGDRPDRRWRRPEVRVCRTINRGGGGDASRRAGGSSDERHDPLPRSWRRWSGAIATVRTELPPSGAVASPSTDGFATSAGSS